MDEYTAKEQYGYIYLTTNVVNNKKYIGQKASPVFLEKYKGSGKHLKNAIEKYGVQNFVTEVLEWCKDKEQLNNREIYWISYYKAVESDDFYNLAKGGDGFKKGSRLSTETKQKMKGRVCSEETRLKRSNKLKGHVVSEETREKISKGNKGKPRSEETIKKLSESHKGKTQTDETKRKRKMALSGEKHYLYGKHHSEEAKRKMSEKKKGKYTGENHPMYGRHHSKEARKKMSENHANFKGENAPCYGKIGINNGKTNKFIFPSELETFLGQGFVKGILTNRHKSNETQS